MAARKIFLKLLKKFTKPKNLLKAATIIGVGASLAEVASSENFAAGQQNLLTTEVCSSEIELKVKQMLLLAILADG